MACPWKRHHLRWFCYHKNTLVAYVIGGIGLICITYMVMHDKAHIARSHINRGSNVHLLQTLEEERRYNVASTDRPYGDLERDIVNDSASVAEVEDKKMARMMEAVDKPKQECSCNSSNYISSDTNSTYDFVLNQSEIKNYFKRGRMVENVSCKLLFDGDSNELIDASMFMSKQTRKAIAINQYITLSKDCVRFKTMRGYLDTSFTKLEQNFPLAFSILFYNDVEQMERLLRAIYRPQNFYCIHVDAKVSTYEKSAIEAIAACFENVFIASRLVKVEWGTFSVLEAEIVCMEDLWAYPSWKYFINLTGQEFPLKTNLELVKILQAMQGANVVDGTWVRARANYFSRWTKSGLSPPHRIRPVKGSVHVAVNRDFVDFALHDIRSRDFLVWLKHTEIPDESFFSSINHNPHLKIPGSFLVEVKKPHKSPFFSSININPHLKIPVSFLGEAEEYPRKPTFTRYKNWDIGHGVWARRCAGKFVRNVCVLGIGDLVRLRDDIGLFVNKFHQEFEPLALDCMEELIYNRTRDQYLGRQHVDVSYYASLDQVRLRYVKPILKGR